ncbi:MAG: transporter, family, multidrug resistance protein [Thermosediminibacterales bacterium]|nr:transporter, family, multidrug resistance protein [Thermosediminibacterales bacterium]
MKGKTKLELALLCLVPFIMVLGNSMLIPVLPAIKSALKTDQFHVGLLITAFSIPAGIIIPFAGILSDQVGRVKVMAPALAVYGFGGLVAGISSLVFEKPYIMILIGRVIQGIGAGGTYQLAMALTGDIFKTKERTKALGLLEASNGLGKVISPIAGALAGLISWFAPFFVYGILAIPIGLVLWFVLKDPKDLQKQNPSEYLDAIKTIFRQKAFPLASCFLSGMVALFVLFGLLSYYSDVLEEVFKIKGFLKGIVIAGPVLAMAIVSFSLGLVLEKVKNSFFKPVIITGLALIALGQLAFCFSHSFWWMLVAVIVLGLGVGSVLPPVNTLITSSASTKRRGIITCLYGSVRFFGVAIGPPAYGFIENFGRVPVLITSTVIVGMVAVTAFFFIREKVLMKEEKEG